MRFVQCNMYPEVNDPNIRDKVNLRREEPKIPGLIVAYVIVDDLYRYAL